MKDFARERVARLFIGFLQGCAWGSGGRARRTVGGEVPARVKKFRESLRRDAQVKRLGRSETVRAGGGAPGGVWERSVPLAR